MNKSKNRFNRAAYGGKAWSPRTQNHRNELGNIWAKAGINSEWAPLKGVLLHKPGSEIFGITDPENYQMLDDLDYKLAIIQHDTVAKAYHELGVKVHYVDPNLKPPPNLMFCADLVFMTPEGAVLGRPASNVRAGEERWVARRLADIGIPILHTFTKQATFEGADALWIDPKTVLVGVGLRTNDEAISQISNILKSMTVEVIEVDLPVGTMHLMGILRFLDQKTALAWPYRLPWRAQRAMKERGIKIQYIPDEFEATENGALNFVTIGPKEILMAADNPITQEFLENIGVKCHTIRVNELHKAAGGIGCLTAVIERQFI